MKVRLERVGARPRNAVPQRERRDDGHDHPGRRGKAPADEYQRNPDQCDRQEIAAQKDCVEGKRRQASDRRDELVGDHQPALRVDERSIARKRVGIDGVGNNWNIERLIGDAVAVASAVRGGKQEEDDASAHPGQRLPRRSRQAKAGPSGACQRLPSSALGP
jgi:hypothetical protein